MMSEQPDLQQRVKAILVNHVGGWLGNGGPDTHCYCGHRGQLGELHCDHVAAAVVTELGLKPVAASSGVIVSDQPPERDLADMSDDEINARKFALMKRLCDETGRDYPPQLVAYLRKKRREHRE